MVRGRDRRGSSHPGTDSLRPRREVASGANLGQQPCPPSRLEKSQPERSVLLLLRSNSCQQKAEYSRSRLHPEIAKLLSQETEWTSNAVGDHHPPPPGETENLKKVAEQFGFPQGGGADPPPLETAPKQDVPATSSSKEKRKKESQRHVGKSSMESAGHAFGPPLQEAYQVEHQKEEEELFQRIDQQVSKPFQRDKRTPRVRASLAKNCPETPRVSSVQSVQGGSQHPLPEHWGRGMGSRLGVGVYRRYYRQILAPKVTSKAIQREMLTLCAVLDHLLDGQILTVADIAAQRLKSLELLAGGSPVELSSQLEFLPKELSNLAGQEESRFVRREFQNETKLNRQLKGGGKSSGGKDQFPTHLKGKGGKSNSKGSKAQQSKVVEVSQT